MGAGTLIPRRSPSRSFWDLAADFSAVAGAGRAEGAWFLDAGFGAAAGLADFAGGGDDLAATAGAFEPLEPPLVVALDGAGFGGAGFGGAGFDAADFVVPLMTGVVRLAERVAVAFF